MALADIRKKIEQDAAAEAAKLLDEAQKQAADLEVGAAAEIAKSKAYYDEMFAAEAPEVRRRAQIIANLDVKKIALGAKQELIAKSFDGALDRLTALPDAQYLAFMEKLLTQATDGGDEELLVSEGEKRISQAWLDGYNASHGTRLSLSEQKADIRGGFLLRKGKVSVNCSLETLIHWLKDELESNVVKRLFDVE